MKLLMWIKEEYDNPEVMVMENGYPDSGSLQDWDRIDYLRGYVRAMLDAIEGGCNVTAYTVWSLLDNFEWRFGYTYVIIYHFSSCMLKVLHTSSQMHVKNLVQYIFESMIRYISPIT